MEFLKPLHVQSPFHFTIEFFSDPFLAVAGSIVTIVTSEGGEAITLAGSALGSAAETVTSFAGHEFTIAASAATASSNAGLTQYDSGPLLASIFTLVLGTTLGALVTL